MTGSALKEPAAKRLKSCEPDLKVIVRYKDQDGKSAEKEYDMHSVILANQSLFVDDNLSDGAKREVVFDADLETFEFALKCLDDPIAANAMSPKDAAKFVQFYHKYDFAKGIQLCDRVFCDYVSEYPQMTLKPLQMILILWYRSLLRW